MGHNLIELSKNNLNSRIIGIEPFLNGVVSVIYNCVKQNIDNILVYPDPVEKFLHKNFAN
jgi:tRNA G46 methylase TrmB